MWLQEPCEPAARPGGVAAAARKGGEARPWRRRAARGGLLLVLALSLVWLGADGHEAVREGWNGRSEWFRAESDGAGGAPEESAQEAERAAALAAAAADLDASVALADAERVSTSSVDTVAREVLSGFAEEEDSVPALSEAGNSSESAEKAQKLALRAARGAPRNISLLPRTLEVAYNEMSAGERYLTYTPSGGWGNQLIELLCATSLALRRNRTVVVPMHARHTNLWRSYLKLEQADLVPMDHVLDMRALSELTGARFLPLSIPFERWLSEVEEGGHVSGGAGAVRARVFSIRSPGLRFPKEGRKAWQRVERQVDVDGAEDALILFRGGFYSHAWLNNGWLSKVRFAPYLLEMAAAAAEVLGGGMYNAVHIRLGDYRYRVKAADATAFVEGAQRKLGFDKGDWLYVAAEESRSDRFFKPLLAGFDKVAFQEDLVRDPRFHRHMVDFVLRTPNSKVRNCIFGLVEQLICTRAQRFLGTRVSTWSMTVGQFRRFLRFTVPTLFEELAQQRATGVVAPRRQHAFQTWERPASYVYKEDGLEDVKAR